MIETGVLRAAFENGLGYAAYVATGTAAQRANWSRGHAAYSLTEGQRGLLQGFTREMRIVVVSGVWCGDCAQECPALDHIARASARVRVRFLDREAADGVGLRVTICGGRRVPVAVFMNEEDEFVSMVGDRTLTRYRELAGQLTGAACPLPGAELGGSVREGVMQEWVNEVERVQLLVRLSAKLRAKHGD